MYTPRLNNYLGFPTVLGALFAPPPTPRSGTTKIKLQVTFSLFQAPKMRTMGMSYFLWAVKLILVDVCLPKDELAALSSTLDIFEG